jgi:hypothetical protein
MAKRNYYDILGVDPNVSQQEIRSSYAIRSRVLHPDRFDQKTQSEEWKKANEMLADLNEAYSVLRNPEKRALYDASIRVAHHGDDRTSEASQGNRSEGGTQGSHKRDSETRSHSRTTDTERATPSTDSKAEEVSVHLLFSTLPQAVKTRLLDRQRGKLTDQMKFQTNTPFLRFVARLFAMAVDRSTNLDSIARNAPLVLGILAIVCLAYVFALAYDHTWTDSEIEGLSALTLASAIILRWGIAQQVLRFTSKLKPHIYLTPLYFIRTSFREVWFWWLWSVRDQNVIHHRDTKGNYTHSTISFVFADGTESFTIRSRKDLESLWAMLRRWEVEYGNAVRERDMDYFLARDDFLEVRQSLKSQTELSTKASKRTRAKVLLGWAVAALFGAGWIFLCFNVNRYIDDKKAWDNACAINRAAAYREYLDAHAKGRWYSDAGRRLSDLYGAATAAYLQKRSAGFDVRASDVVLEMLNYAKAAGRYKIRVAFERHNDIPYNIEDQLRSRFQLANVIPLADSFSEAKMQAREKAIMQVLRPAFSEVIASDILELVDSGFEERNIAMVVTYNVKAGQSVYFRESDAYLSRYNRPFYPGISFDWSFEIRIPSNVVPYVFTLQSTPAESFSYTSSPGKSSSLDERETIYDKMAESAFYNFRSEVVRRLGLKGNSPEADRANAAESARRTETPPTLKKIPTPADLALHIAKQEEAGDTLAEEYGGSIAKFAQDVFTEAIDLDRDGKPEFVVVPHYPTYCGSGGCELLIYARVGNEYKLLYGADTGEGLLVGLWGPSSDSLRLGRNYTNGYLDLEYRVSGTVTVLKFDGTYYRRVNK